MRKNGHQALHVQRQECALFNFKTLIFWVCVIWMHLEAHNIDDVCIESLSVAGLHIVAP